MPILTVKISAPATPQLTQAIAEMLLAHSERILHKVRQVTAIVIEHLPPEQWFVGGQSLATQGLNSFYCDIRITDETNSKQEKAQFIAETYAGFATLLGPVHEESYIHVHDVRATAYGYGGKTQEYRYHHPASDAQ